MKVAKSLRRNTGPGKRRQGSSSDGLREGEAFRGCPIDQIRVRGSEGILTRSMIKPQRRLSSHTAMKKYRFERKGRRSFDTPPGYDTARTMVSEKTRTTKPGGPRYRLDLQSLAVYHGIYLERRDRSCDKKLRFLPMAAARRCACRRRFASTPRKFSSTVTRAPET